MIRKYLPLGVPSLTMQTAVTFPQFFEWYLREVPGTKPAEADSLEERWERWHADTPGRRSFHEIAKVERIVLHHSETSTGNRLYFRLLHCIVNDWDDIGYHYVIGNGADGLSREGAIEIGRNAQLQGAHVFGHNRNSLGVCIVGNYDEQRPSAPVMTATLNFLHRLLRQYELTPTDVLGHHEFPGATKSCPGSFINMDDVRSRLSDLVTIRACG